MKKDYSRTNWSDEKLQTIADAKDSLKRMINACEMIEAGYAEAKACRDNNVDQNAFRRFIGSKSLGYHCSIDDIDITDIDVQKRIKKDILSWQELVWLDIFGEKDITLIPTDINEQVESAIESLNEQEQKVIFYRYKDQQTLEECGKILGVHKERIRQVQAKALRKLRHPSKSRTLRFGNEFQKRLNEIRSQISEDRLSEKIIYYKDEVERKKELNDTKALLELKEKIENILAGKNEDVVDESRKEYGVWGTQIDNLGLSVRAYTCLRRAGINTYGDLREMTADRMLKVRNLGRKSLCEVINACRANNLDMLWIKELRIKEYPWLQNVEG